MSSSPTSNIDLFGRRWEIKITTQSGETITYSSSAWEPESLRGTFEITQNLSDPVWTCVVSIYNLNYQSATSAIPGAAVAGGAQISMGDALVISAGYQSGANYGVVWSGQIYQVTYERENVVDYKTTFLCFASIDGWQRNLTATNYPAQASQYSVIKQMIASSQTPGAKLQISDADQATLSAPGSPRGGVVFGDLAKYMNMTAAAQNSWVAAHTGLGLLLGSVVVEDTATPDLVYAPAPPPGVSISYNTPVTQSLIGSPVQYEGGVEFSVLLDARLKCTLPPQLVRLDMAVIAQMRQSIAVQGNNVPQLSLVTPLDKTSQYYVVGLRHVGDTRDNTWLTFVVGGQNLETQFAS